LPQGDAARRANAAVAALTRQPPSGIGVHTANTAGGPPPKPSAGPPSGTGAENTAGIPLENTAGVPAARSVTGVGPPSDIGTENTVGVPLVIAAVPGAALDFLLRNADASRGAYI